jgi:hypothetical protein
MIRVIQGDSLGGGYRLIIITHTKLLDENENVLIRISVDFDKMWPQKMLQLNIFSIGKFFVIYNI